MTPPQANSTASSRQDPFRWSRSDRAEAHAAFRDPFDFPASQRQYAQQHGIPRSTLGDWLRQQTHPDVEPQLDSFLRSPCGERFLRRLVGALLLVFVQANACGIRTVGRFLVLMQLDHYVGASYGALYTLAQRMQHDLALFDEEERERLGKSMTPRTVAVCGDENFHGPQQCLVAMEPVSNFIFIETYRDHRDAPTWTEVIRLGIGTLRVTVVLLTSDQAPGLICCAQDGLQVLYSPDLMHLQQSLCRPLLLPLSRPIHKAQKDLEKATQQSERLSAMHMEQLRGQRPALPADHCDRTQESVRQEFQAKERMHQSQEQLDKAVAAVRGLGDDYHPFDRQTGQAISAVQMQQRLEKHTGALAQVVEQADLSQTAQAAVDKASEWLTLLVGCVAWFWTTTQRRLEALALSAEAEQFLQECLLPGCYWETAARRARTAAERKRLQELGEQLQRQAWAPQGALARLSAAEQQEVQRVARECVGLFSRSSSCVEGRNGRLSLYHHGQSRLSAERLKALTAVHNYVCVRDDGTTAAERFFGQKPRDVFAWLLERMPELPRPAAKRPKKAG
jgi:Family of unknown function (DUF6399)